jgi:hypothetical protein
MRGIRTITHKGGCPTLPAREVGSYFVLLELYVMTLLYILNCADDLFLQEHIVENAPSTRSQNTQGIPRVTNPSGPSAVG